MNKQNSIIGMFREGADGVTSDMDKIVGRADKIGSLETCAVACWIAHPNSKEKRNACLQACAVKFPPLSPPGSSMGPLPGSSIAPLPGSSIPARPGSVTPAHLVIPYSLNPIIPYSDKPPVVSDGNMLDFSSPLNTIVKSFFLLSLSPMFAGTYNFYIISVGCSGAIIYSLFKQFNR